MNDHDALAHETLRRLDALCLTHPDRHVGGPGGRDANELFAREVTRAGFSVERLSFDCVDWEYSEASLVLPDGQEVPLSVGPYSPPFDGRGTLISVSSVAELEGLSAPGSILLLHGEIAAEQITPRHYPFYRMDSHTYLLGLLGRVAPAAVIAATDRTPMAAALRPFPLFEDADLGFPSAYLTAEKGADLIPLTGETVTLRIDSRAVPRTAEQLVARAPGREGGHRSILVSAHIDSRHGTPGALDNASGVCVLLALADLMGEAPPVDVVLLPFNGEDNFAAYGEVAYLHAHEETLDDVVLAVNIDAAGRRGDKSAFSFYSCPDELRELVERVAGESRGIEPGPEWPMSDHMVFAMRGVPAMAITSTGLIEIASTVAHTAADTPELVDPDLVVDTARFILGVIGEVGTGYHQPEPSPSLESR